MATNVCPQCHNTTYHFDKAKHASVCDICGWEQNSPERTQEMLTYDQHRQKAIAFTKARDYISARPFLDKMRSIHPDDPDIYYLYIMGLTDCCQNLLLLPQDRHTYLVVEDYWKTFCALNGDKRVFLVYFQKRDAEKKKIRDKELTKTVFTASLCYFILLVSIIIMICAENYYFLITAGLFAIIIWYYKPLTKLLKAINNKDI